MSDRVMDMGARLELFEMIAPGERPGWERRIVRVSAHEPDSVDPLKEPGWTWFGVRWIAPGVFDWYQERPK